MPDLEREIFDAASAKEDFTTEEAPAPAAVEPEVRQPEAPQTAEEPNANEAEHPEEPNRGDLGVALRREREALKQMRQDLERERAERVRFMNMLESQRQPQQSVPQPAAEEPDFWSEDPKQWVSREVSKQTEAYKDQLFETRSHFSRLEAVRTHGEERVNDAYKALDEAVSGGKMDREAVMASLRQSTDPFRDIVAWHDNQPQVQEQRMRERLETEFREKYGLGETAPATAAAPARPSLPSLNRAVGTAGAQQSGTITEEDIFQAAPAFGRRK